MNHPKLKFTEEMEHYSLLVPKRLKRLMAELKSFNHVDVPQLVRNVLERELTDLQKSLKKLD